jgi:putative nucleotidyltransferase with HDIG domain
MAYTSFRRLPARTTAYVVTVVVCGAAAVIHSFAEFYVHPIKWPWAILAILTLVSGSATVKLPALPATVSVSETFVFTSVLLFGSAAGTLIVALDALIISSWSYRKGQPIYKIIFNVCAVPLAMWVASHVYYALAPHGPLYLSKDNVQISQLLLPLLIFTVVYYVINTWLITLAISLERQLSPTRIWKDNFVWIALNYFGGASVAALLVSYTKDFNYTSLLIIVPLLLVLYFTFSTSMGRVEDANRHLSQMNALYMSTIETLAMAIDAKDQITHGHIRRVQSYAIGLAKAMGIRDQAQIRAIEAAALLHDMGKLAVPEYILNKPGPLTPAEFEKMKLHASVGADILSAIEFPYPVVPIVRHHHENWDGTGYPTKIAGAEIPIGARILAVVDCFDALTSDRPYRPRLSDKEAIRILQERRGSMYDPLIVDTFTKVHESIATSTNEAVRALPLKAIAAASSGPPAFSESQTARLEEIAASSDEMLTLFEIARSLTTNTSLQDAADLIAKHLRRLIPSSACVFYVYDLDHDELRATHAFGEHETLIKGLRIPVGQRLSGWVAANRQTVRNSDPVLDLGESARAMTPRPRSCLSTPLVLGKSLVGVLSLYSSNKDSYSEDHERIIEVVARQVSPVIADAYEAERQRSAVLRDHGTGLPNLRRLIDFVEDQLSGLDSHPLSVVVIRCEPFSGPGEASPGLIASIRRCMRPADLLFRTDTSELTVVLLNTDRNGARPLVDKIRTVLAAWQEEHDASGCIVGVASAPSDGLQAVLLLGKAREQMPRPLESRAEPPEAIH